MLDYAGWLGLVGLCLACACGDPDGGNGGVGVDELDGGDTPNAAHDSGVDNGDGAGADAGTDGDSDAGAPVTASSLQPLEPGSYWTYEVVNEDPTGSEPCGENLTSMVVRKTEAGGREAIEATNACQGGERYFSKTDQGIEILLVSNAWGILLADPIEEGKTWMLGMAQYIWNEVGTIQVPAGTFHDCWVRNSPTGNLPTTTFCPGVGVVRSVNYKYTLVLSSYRSGP